MCKFIIDKEIGIKLGIIVAQGCRSVRSGRWSHWEKELEAMASKVVRAWHSAQLIYEQPWDLNQFICWRVNQIGAYLHSPDMSNLHISDDDFGSDFDSAAEEDLLGGDSDNLPVPVLSPTQYTANPTTAPLRSYLSTLAENPTRRSTSSMPAEMCVVSS